MRGLLESKVAVITGGNSGIGKATALAFAREGARVVVAARRQEEGDETANLIRAQGGDAIFIQTDVTQAAQVQAMVERIVETFGRLDCAFNNAGRSGNATIPTHDYPEDIWQRVMDVNITGKSPPKRQLAQHEKKRSRQCQDEAQQKEQPAYETNIHLCRRNISTRMDGLALSVFTPRKPC